MNRTVAVFTVALVVFAAATAGFADGGALAYLGDSEGVDVQFEVDVSAADLPESTDGRADVLLSPTPGASGPPAHVPRDNAPTPANGTSANERTAGNATAPGNGPVNETVGVRELTAKNGTAAHPEADSRLADNGTVADDESSADAVPSVGDDVTGGNETLDAPAPIDDSDSAGENETVDAAAPETDSSLVDSALPTENESVEEVPLPSNETVDGEMTPATETTHSGDEAGSTEPTADPSPVEADGTTEVPPA